MSDHLRYTSILKAQPEEAAALRVLDTKTAGRVIPLLVFSNKLLTETPDIDRYLESIFSHEKGSPVFERPMLIDLQCFDSHSYSAGPTLKKIFDHIAEMKIKIVPAVSLKCSDSFKQEIANIPAERRNGACLYIEDRDYGVENLERLINQTLDMIGCTPGDTDLVLDYRTINEAHFHALLASVIYRISGLPHLMRWRSLTIAGVSFPHDIANLAPGINEIPRVEWKLWKQLQKMKLKRIPAFGDYDTFHPQHPDDDPKMVERNPRLRYTIEDEWLVLSEYDVEKLSPEKFTALCRELVESNSFCGRDFSWGDAFIHACATGEGDAESLATWRTACTSHHLTFIARRIEALDKA